MMGRAFSSLMPFVDGDVIAVRIFDHRHAADRRVEGFHDERHGPLLHLMDECVEIRHLKRHDGPFRPWHMAHVRRRDGEG